MDNGDSLQGDFGTNPYTEYALTDDDWKGSINNIDFWVSAFATEIENDEGSILTVDTPDYGAVLNQRGSTYFLTGIRDLHIVRPHLFELSLIPEEFTNTEWTGAMQAGIDMPTKVGPMVMEVLDDTADIVGQDGEDLVGVLTGVAALIAVILGGIAGSMGSGIIVAFVIILIGTDFGGVAVALVGTMIAISLVIFAWEKMYSR